MIAGKWLVSTGSGEKMPLEEARVFLREKSKGIVRFQAKPGYSETSRGLRAGIGMARQEASTGGPLFRNGKRGRLGLA